MTIQGSQFGQFDQQAPYRLRTDALNALKQLHLFDLPPVPGRHASIGRDPEYVRHGTLSVLTALDLHNGEIIALLKRLDAHYPEPATIRVVLDNHSAHISKETMAYLATRPGRFEYVHTPKHGSWLNLIECVFSKMRRSFLRITEDRFQNAWQRLMRDAKKQGVIASRFTFHDLKAKGVSDFDGDRRKAAGHRTERAADIYDRKREIVPATR